MSLFENGRPFTVALRCSPPAGERVPYVTVEMAGGASDTFVIVRGKVDSGASRTMLNFETARRLGIQDPECSALETREARTATDEVFSYYVHLVSVRVGEEPEAAIEFPLRAAFAERVKRNLFGIDWLQHLCLAMDAQAVHFLKD